MPTPLTPTTDLEFDRDLLVAFPRLTAFARRRLRRPQDAEDIAADTLETAIRKRSDFELGTDLMAWLLKTAQNKVKNANARKDSHEGSLDVYEPVALETQLHAVGAVTRSAEDESADRDPGIAAPILAAIGPGAATAIWLDSEGYTAREAAQHQGISESAAVSRLHRARTAAVKAAEVLAA